MHISTTKLTSLQYTSMHQQQNSQVNYSAAWKQPPYHFLSFITIQQKLFICRRDIYAPLKWKMWSFDLVEQWRPTKLYPAVPLLLHQWRQYCSTMSHCIRKTTLHPATANTTTATFKLAAPSAATAKLPVVEAKEASGACATTDSGSRWTTEETVLTQLLPVRPFPMELIVDQNTDNEALFLTAVNFNIHGLVIGGWGEGKTVLARSIWSILPLIIISTTTTTDINLLEEEAANAPLGFCTSVDFSCNYGSRIERGRMTSMRPQR